MAKIFIALFLSMALSEVALAWDHEESIAVDKKNGTSFTARRCQQGNNEWFYFNVERNDTLIEVVLSKNAGVISFGSATCGKKILNNRYKEVPEFLNYPDKEILFFNNMVADIFTNISYMGHSSYSDGNKYWEFSYDDKSYFCSSENIFQMKNSGKTFENFDDGVDLELGQGRESGEWEVFKHAVIKSSKNYSGKLNYKFRNTITNPTNELKVYDGTLRWSFTPSELMYEFWPNDTQCFYMEIALGRETYVKHVSSIDQKGIIEHSFNPAGGLEISARRNGDGDMINYYSIANGKLLRRESTSGKFVGKVMVDEYDEEKEYEAVKYDTYKPQSSEE